MIKSPIIACCAMLGAFVAGTASASVIDGPVSFGGHTYYLLSQNDWTASEAEAVSLGGHLVTIGSAAEDAFVYSTFSVGDDSRALWIGLNDVAVEGTFVWSSGEPVVYTNWAAGEPTDTGGVEDWAHIFPGIDPRVTMWNDAPDLAFNFGVFPMHGVVEVVPTPPGAAVLAMAGVLASRRHSRTRRHD